MNHNQCLFIGCKSHEDPTHAINTVMCALKIPHSSLEFTTSQDSRLMTELIESVSIVGKHYPSDFIFCFDQEKEKLVSILRDGVQVVAIVNRYYNNIQEIKEIIDFIHENNREVLVVLGGGFFVSALSKLRDNERKFILKFIGADIYINRFRCETQIIGIMKAVNSTNMYEGLTSVNNILYRMESDYVSTKNVNESNDLEDNHIFFQNYSSALLPITSLNTTISCPFSCSFCAVKQRTEKFRRRPIGIIKEELLSLRKINRTQIINFTDETINLPVSEFEKFLYMLIEIDIGYKWYSFFRTEYITNSLASLMKKSGCLAVMLGIESGNDVMLNRMNKGVNSQQLENSLTIFKKHGIHTICFFIVGFPGETKESIQDSVDFINRTNPSFYRIHPWECEIETSIWEQREAYGLQLKNGIWSHNSMNLHEAKETIKQMNNDISCSCSIEKADYSFALQLLNANHSLETVQNIYRYLG